MTDKTANEHGGETAGLLYAGVAYAFWGIMPIYWRLLGDVPPFELTDASRPVVRGFRGDRDGLARPCSRIREHPAHAEASGHAGADQRSHHLQLDDLHLLRGDQSARRSEPRLLSDAAAVDCAGRVPVRRAHVALPARGRDPRGDRRRGAGGGAWATCHGSAFRWRCRSASTAISARKRRSIPWTDCWSKRRFFFPSRLGSYCYWARTNRRIPSHKRLEGCAADRRRPLSRPFRWRCSRPARGASG